MSDKPKYFFETERGKVVGHCTHDIVNAVSLSCGIARNLLRDIEAGKVDIDKLKDNLQTIIERQEKANYAIDFLYSSIKKLEGY